jgi:GNAT superfamily N-acetyltransferase
LVAARNLMKVPDAAPRDSDALGLVTVSASNSAFVGAIPEELYDFGWTPEASATGWRDTFDANTDRGQHFLVLEAEERVVGFLWLKPWAEFESSYGGEVQALYVLPTWQGRGVGRTLLGHAMRLLRAGGKDSVEIGCIRENPNCDFYRHLGGVEIGRRPNRVDRFETEELFFGWRDLGLLE